MTEPTESQAAQHVLNPETFSRYLVRDHREIRQILAALIEKRALLTVHVGAVHFVSAVLDLTPDGQSMFLDASPDETLNRRAFDRGEIVCGTKLDNIRVQFTVNAIEATTHDGYQALKTPVPDGVLRLQRREYFRLPAPQAEPLICALTVNGPNGATRTVEARILDISAGGVAVMVPPEGIDFSPGMEFGDCSLRLPDGPIPVRFKVRNLFHVDVRSGARVLRAGCEFLALSGGAMNRIQRYIFRVERERNARESGF